jgi:hypothetical protein
VYKKESMGVCCSNEVVLYVDGSYVCMNCSKDRTGEYLLLNGFDFPVDLSEFVEKKTNAICECGGDKLKSGHSDWCAKYSKS